MIFWELIFFVRIVKGEKGRTRNFKKQFKTKKVYFAHFFFTQKKQENRIRKKHDRKRKSRRCPPQFVG